MKRTLLSLFAALMTLSLMLAVAPARPGDAQTDQRYFPETQHWVKGLFLKYWNEHGGLAQQGYPLTEEFQEVNKLDSKTYTVQYFERAIFERHPENAGTPYEVLLSQLGKFELDGRYPNNGNPAAAPHPSPPDATPVVAPTTQPTAPPAPTTGPTQPPNPCTDVPPSKDATVTPSCGTTGDSFDITITGFANNEGISFWVTAPNGNVAGTAAPLNVGAHGPTLRDRFDGSDFAQLAALINAPVEGVWAVTYQGSSSGHQSIVYIKIHK